MKERLLRLNGIKLAMSTVVLIALFFSGTIGPLIASLGGISGMAYASTIAGAVSLAGILIFRKQSLKGKGREFWLHLAEVSMLSAAVTVTVAEAVRSGLPVNVLGAMTGLGLAGLMYKYLLGNKSSGWRLVVLCLTPILLLSGLLIFAQSGLSGGIPAWGLVFAGVASLALAAYTFVFQRVTKVSAPADRVLILMMNVPVSGIILLVGMLVVRGEIPGANFNGQILLEIAGLGLFWLVIPTYLNQMASQRLPMATYTALQQLGGPVSALGAFLLMGQALPFSRLGIADLLLSAAGVAVAIVVPVEGSEAATATVHRAVIDLGNVQISNDRDEIVVRMYNRWIPAVQWKVEAAVRAAVHKAATEFQGSEEIRNDHTFDEIVQSVFVDCLRSIQPNVKRDFERWVREQLGTVFKPATLPEIDWIVDVHVSQASPRIRMTIKKRVYDELDKRLAAALAPS